MDVATPSPTHASSSSHTPAAAPTTAPAAPTTPPLPFHRLNSHVYVSPADEAATGFDPASPSVVIVFGWFNANVSHEKKYIESFRALYPTSTLVLVKSDTSWLWTSQAGREALLEPVAVLLDRTKREQSERWRGLLLHAMSNGGGMQLLVLSKLLARRPGTAASSAGLDPVALVLDSVPDSNGLRCMVVVFTQAVRSPLARLVAIPALAFLYSLFALAYGAPAVFTDMRQRLNAPRLVPLAKRRPGSDGSDTSAGTQAQPGTDIPRLYIASKADTMTRFAQVQAHMDEAARRGLDVRAEIFEHTTHVSHAKQEPARYWGAIQELWRAARASTPVVRPRL